MGSLKDLAVALVSLCTISSIANGQIYLSETAASQPVGKRVRVSVKIMNDGNGNRPPDGFYRTEDQILAVFDDCNATLSAMGADWRLEVVEILDVRGASEWYGPFSCNLKREFDAHARADRARYLFRNNAINIYIISELTGCGGYCSIPSSGDDTIIINNRVGILNWSLGWLHEIGHYFGLQHTYQCPNRPCQSNHNICTGAGSELRDCPDVCPDTRNIMGGNADLVVGQAAFSPCQLSELARSMRAGSGFRSKVVEHDDVEAPAVDQCANADHGGAGASAMAPTPALIVSDVPRGPTNEPPVTQGPSANGGTTNAGACDEVEDLLPPAVLRIDPQFTLGTARVNGVVIEFTEPIDTSEVQNGIDIAITYESSPMTGSISWRNDNRTLAWTARTSMPAGQYGIFLTSQDKTDFQDRAGNVLQANTEGYFAVAFALDGNGQLLLPSSAACGTGVLFSGMTMLPLATAARVRRRRRA